VNIHVLNSCVKFKPLLHLSVGPQAQLVVAQLPLVAKKPAMYKP